MGINFRSSLVFVFGFLLLGVGVYFLFEKQTKVSTSSANSSFRNEIARSILGRPEVVDTVPNPYSDAQIKEAVRSKDARQLYRLALQAEFESPDIDNSFKHSRDVLTDAAKFGSAEAMFRLGVYCGYGIGGEKDEVKAVKICRKAIDGGFSQGFAILPEFVRGNLLLQLSPLESIKLAELCQSGDPSANFFNSVVSLRSAPAGDTSGIQQLEVAAALGSPQAILRLHRNHRDSNYVFRSIKDESFYESVGGFLEFDRNVPPIADTDLQLHDDNLKKIVKALFALEAAGNGQAALSIAVSVLQLPNLGVKELRVAEYHARWALVLGSPSAYFYLAKIEFLRKNPEKAKHYIQLGTSKKVWRCEYTELLSKKESTFVEALEKADTARYVDYGAALFQRQASDSRITPPIPVSENFGQLQLPPQGDNLQNTNLIIVSFVVNTDGIPVGIEISTDPIQDIGSLKDAVKTWRFKPAYRDGVKVPVGVQIPIVVDNSSL